MLYSNLLAIGNCVLKKTDQTERSMQCQVELFSLVTVKIYQNYTSTTFYSDEQRFEIVY